MSTFSRLSMALGTFTFGVGVYCVYEFWQTQNFIMLAIPVGLILISLVVIIGQKRNQKRA